MKTGLDQGGGAQRARRAATHAAKFPAANEKARDVARKTSWRSFLPDGGDRSVAAHPDALLHHTQREGGENSVFWSLFFIFLLYFTAPALAVLVKSRYLHECRWAASLVKLPAGEFAGEGGSVAAINRRRQQDGIVQLAEIAIGGDIGARYAGDCRSAVCHPGLVAAGGLAAASPQRTGCC